MLLRVCKAGKEDASILVEASKVLHVFRGGVGILPNAGGGTENLYNCGKKW
jgi:hypothetical protein